MKEKTSYLQWLISCYELPGKVQRQILQAFPDPGELFGISKDGFEAVLPEQFAGIFWQKCREVGSVQGMLERMEKLKERGICFVTQDSPDYPDMLREIPDPPIGLYYTGRLPRSEEACVAIIGSRECSEYGRKVASELGRYLGERSIPVISGMARGIDGISQQAALDAGGASFGVLGCGVDVCYPQSNQGLYQLLQEKGGILSAYPPGTPPLACNFPPRNRIVSGLAMAVVVVEAAVRSGTSITVSMALEQGREVYVVPGRVTDRLSEGCNQLIKDGAAVYLNPGRFVEELEEAYFLHRIRPDAPPAAIREEEPSLTPEQKEIWKALDHTPKSVEEIQRSLATKISVQTCSIRLMELTLQGKAKQITAGRFCKN